jgi:hypothetical protein
LIIIKNEMIMKTKSIVLAAFLLMTALATFGSDEPKKAGIAVVPMKGSEVVKVIYKSETTGKVKLNVYDAKHEMVYSEAFNDTNGFILPLNFSKVGYGEYTFEFVDANGKRTEKVVYEPAKHVDNIRVAKIDGGQGKFLVAVANPANEKVTVRIFDAYNNLLHDEVRNVSGNFAQVYTVKNLKGACTFEVSDNAGFVKTVQF